MNKNKFLYVLLYVFVVGLLRFNFSSALINTWPYLSIDVAQVDKVEGQASAAGDKLSITIDGRHKTTITADASGVWRYTPIGVTCGVKHLVRVYNLTKGIAYQGDFATPKNRFNAFTMDHNNISASSRIPYVNGEGAGVFGASTTSKSGRYTYFNDNSTGNIGIVDMETGAITHVGTSGGSYSLVSSPDGRFLYTNDGSIFDINGANEATPVQVFSGKYSSYFGFSISPDGSKLILADTVNKVSVYDINVATGDVTLNTILTIPGANVIYGAFISPDGNNIIAPGYYENKIHRIDISAGLSSPIYTSINTIGGSDLPVYAVFHPDNSTVYINNYGNSVESVSAIDLNNNNIYYVNAPAGQGGSIAISVDGRYLIVPINGNPEKIMYLDTSADRLSPAVVNTIDTALDPGASSEYVGYSAPSETKTFYIPCTPQIGVAKTVESAVSVGGGQYDLTFKYLIKNYGKNPLDNVSLLEDLASRFPFPVTTAVQSVTADAGLTVNGSYDGSSIIDMLSGTDSLAPEESKNVSLVVRVGNIGRAISGDYLDYYNQVKVLAMDGASVVSDDSVDNSKLDPDTNGDNDPTEQSPSLIDFPPPAGTIGVSEQIVNATNVGSNTMRYQVNISLKNYGDLALNSNISLFNDLLSTFPGATAANFNMVSAPYIVSANNATLNLDSTYNGTTSTNIINTAGANLIDIGGEIIISFTFDISLSNVTDIDGPWTNYSEAIATDALGVDSKDVSNNGTNPDLNNNGIANEDSDNIPSTMSLINTPPVAIDDSAATAINTAANINVLNSDSDAEDSALQVSSASIATGDTAGTVTINSDNTITYIPTTTFIGTTTVNYTIVDDNGATATAVITIVVKAYCDPPTNSVELISSGDCDNDGITNQMEGYDPDTTDNVFDATLAVDTDGDGLADYLDLDSDNDGILDIIEKGPVPGNVVDTDNDSVPDFRDLDSDNDKLLDLKEAGQNYIDANGDGIVDGAIDSSNGLVLGVSTSLTSTMLLDANNNNIPDYMEVAATTTPTTTNGTGTLSNTGSALLRFILLAMLILGSMMIIRSRGARLSSRS